MHVCLQVDHSRVQVVRPSEPSREVHTQRKQPSLSLSLFINFKFQSESLLIYCKKLKMIMQSERRLFTKFYREMFCWIDNWYGLTMADIRRIEDEVKAKLDKVRLIQNKKLPLSFEIKLIMKQTNKQQQNKTGNQRGTSERNGEQRRLDDRPWIAKYDVVARYQHQPTHAHFHKNKHKFQYTYNNNNKKLSIHTQRKLFRKPRHTHHRINTNESLQQQQNATHSAIFYLRPFRHPLSQSSSTLSTRFLFFSVSQYIKQSIFNIHSQFTLILVCAFDLLFA